MAGGGGGNRGVFVGYNYMYINIYKDQDVDHCCIQF